MPELLAYVNLQRSNRLFFAGRQSTPNNPIPHPKRFLLKFHGCLPPQSKLTRSIGKKKPML